MIRIRVDVDFCFANDLVQKLHDVADAGMVDALVVLASLQDAADTEARWKGASRERPLEMENESVIRSGLIAKMAKDDPRISMPHDSGFGSAGLTTGRRTKLLAAFKNKVAEEDTWTCTILRRGPRARTKQQGSKCQGPYSTQRREKSASTFHFPHTKCTVDWMRT
ncbi:hypothetical protein FVE85_7542 [Porphyridium purpureum]|uniref:Uncharacterized protein n=1 Tax=Porphyridium purpureum TaxID=35688 RepID=A0A5J4ZBC8_PORPP|nr:hypothetical protein FVE85_7542 [Porphyridium purpureum]|eukprot:POR0311..scf295_1